MNKYEVVWHDCEDKTSGQSFYVNAETPKQAYFKAINQIRNSSDYLDKHFCGIDLECLVDEAGKFHYPEYFL